MSERFSFLLKHTNPLHKRMPKRIDVNNEPLDLLKRKCKYTDYLFPVILFMKAK